MRSKVRTFFDRGIMASTTDDLATSRKRSERMVAVLTLLEHGETWGT
jgi:hypothetical protein